MGYIYTRKKEYDKAVREFNRALELNPGDSSSCAGLGFLYLDKGNPSRAQEEFTRAVDIDPDNEYAHIGLGQAYFRQAKHDAAMKEFMTDTTSIGESHTNDDIEEYFRYEKEVSDHIQEILKQCRRSIAI